MSGSFYANEFMVKERVNTAIEEGLRSQAVHRSGAPKLGLFHELRQFIQGFLDRRTSESPLSMVQAKSLRLTFVRVLVATTILLLFVFFG
jgi:hypothetical protein